MLRLLLHLPKIDQPQRVDFAEDSREFRAQAGWRETEERACGDITFYHYHQTSEPGE